MRLFVFRPNVYGANTFAVCASSDREARQAVEEHIEKTKGVWKLDEADSDGESIYKLEVYGPGQVAENDNA